MNTIFINFPHALHIFKVVAEESEVIDRIKDYYGSTVCFEIDSDENCIVQLQVLGDRLLVIKNKEIIADTEVGSDIDNITCSIYYHIRKNLFFCDGWAAYHGSCANINGYTYLFIGPSKAGKTTLSAYLSYQPNVTMISEDMLIVNYKTRQIVPINRQLYIRPHGYELLTQTYGITFENAQFVIFNKSERVFCCPCNNTQITQPIYKVDIILFIFLENTKVYFEQNSCQNDLIENFYSPNDIKKSIHSSYQLTKLVPMYNMHYYNLNEVYKTLLEARFK